MISINNIKEINPNLPLSEEDHSLSRSNQIKDQNLFQKEDIDKLLWELSEIENKLNNNSYNIEIKDQNDEPIESINL